MKIKLLTRNTTPRLEPEIYLAPVKKGQNGKPIQVGKVLSVTSCPSGKRVMELEIDERNKRRFESIENPYPENAEEVTEWVETYFEFWHNRRLLLPTKNR